MIIYKKILGFLLSFLSGFVFIFINYKPDWIAYIIICYLLLLLFYFWRIKNRFVKYSELFKYFIIFFCFIFSVFLFFITLDNFFIKIIVSIFVMISAFFIFESIFKRIYENIEIKLELFTYVDLICFFGFIYFLFYSYIILKTNLFALISYLFIFSFILTNIRFYWNKINIKRNILNALIICIVLIELYLATLFLPFNFYLSSFVVWIWYYLITDFFVLKIRDEFIWRKKRKMVIFAIILFILSIISIR